MGMLFYERYPLEVGSNYVYFRDAVAQVTSGGVVFNPELKLTNEQKETISAFVAEAKEKGKEY